MRVIPPSDVPGRPGGEAEDMTTENLRTLSFHPPLRPRGGGRALALVVLGWIGVIGLVAVAAAAPFVLAGGWMLTQLLGR
jgi:hypothetical protein